MKPFDANGDFSPTVPGGGHALRRMAVRGAGATLLSGGIALAIQIVATVVLGRLLTPRDFGLATMVTTFSLLLMNGPANGFIDSLLQRKEVTHALASTLFWVSLGIGAVLTVGFAAAGPLLAKFYGEPSLPPITAGLSLTILFTAVPIIHAALLRRAMQFTALAKNDIIARAVGVLASIAFGLAGWGYWSLVIGACALAASTAVGVFILCPWLPGPPRRRTGSATTLRFASHISGRFSLNYFARNSDNLLVGWRFGAHALGFYKKAYDLFALSAGQLVSATSNVAVSALSRVRDDRPQYIRYVLGAIAVMSFLGMGLAGDLTLVGKDLIRVLLGPKWSTAGVIFTYFAPGIGVMIVYYIHGWIHVSIGRADRWLRWSIVEWIVTFGSFLLFLPFGPQGIAVAWCVTYWVLTIPAMGYAGKPIGLGAARVLETVWRYVVASLMASLVTYITLGRASAMQDIPGAAGALLRIAATTLLFCALYLGGVTLLHGGTEPLRRILRLLGELRGKGQAKSAAPDHTTGGVSVA
ncbi:lipopolysaccharide biosynthesis protein [Acidobacteria bacterium AB60]|nr:lipopolysaccharide biosynthesis protein [Acidobacteria bacterium AB60]